MTRRLEGRVAVVTGAGRGLGAAYALALADHGAKVVLNDLGAGLQGEKIDEDPVVQVAEAIRAKGGEAVIDRGDVADFDAAGQLIETALSSFGKLDILINNAGILRDRMLVNMTVQEWDDVIRVHLRGHFCPTQHAAVHWRERAKQGKADAVLIHTTSIAGLHGNVGQANYSTAKSGLATLAYLNHLELNARYGVRAYAIAPNARTRLTLNSPGAADLVREPEAGTFDYFSPDNVAAFVAWLGAADCAAPSGTIYGVEGGLVRRYDAWHIATSINNGDKRWTFEELDARVDELAAGHERTFTPLSEILIAPGQAPRA